jgi:hypothetical protein
MKMTIDPSRKPRRRSRVGGSRRRRYAIKGAETRAWVFEDMLAVGKQRPWRVQAEHGVYLEGVTRWCGWPSDVSTRLTPTWFV